MSSNNYITPYQFTQPPPNYNSNSSWNYNWSTNQTQSVRNFQAHRAVPPPPPLPPYPPPDTYRAPPPPPPVVNTVSPEQKSQNYYNSSPQGSYHTRRYSNSATGQYNGTNGQYKTTPTGQYKTTPGQYSTTGQYNSVSPGSYVATNASAYIRNYYGKRRSEAELDGLRKSSKKKKKPLSQNVRQRKDWSVSDAKRALMVEKEYNKRHRNHSLIIKFPDIELNRDMVSKFNSAIENVHFQQPSTARFCFVTLNDAADPDVVIKELNKTPFGQGFLSAEYKRDREDDINIGPEDIDPMTLYVGNLAQEVTKDDMVNTYPKQKRIDIGFAKKMKYTRYAFVSFKTVDDCIEAFKKTHSTQMYSKSLIVRFRRLNGTVGMPGEAKPQMPQRNDAGEPQNNGSHSTSVNDTSDLGHNTSSDIETESCTSSRLAPWEMVDVSNWETELKLVKEEPLGDTDDEDDIDIERKPPRRDYMSPFMPGSLEVAFSLHKPKIKVEVKKEKGDEDHSMSSSVGDESNDVSQQGDELLGESKPTINSNSSDGDCMIILPDKIKTDPEKTDNRNSYDSLRSLNKKLQNSDFVPVKIKREISVPTVDEVSTDWEERVSIADTEESIRIKCELDDKGDETNDGDQDNSSDSDDFNFNSMLSSIEDRKKRLKKSVASVNVNVK